MTKRRQESTDLEPIERASRDELQALQLERLKWSVRPAFDRVASYRKKCTASGAHPDDLRTSADLARFPFTTKQDLRDGYPFGLCAVPRSDVVRVHASSGTTGKTDRGRLTGARLAKYATAALLIVRSSALELSGAGDVRSLKSLQQLGGCGGTDRLGSHRESAMA